MAVPALQMEVNKAGVGPYQSSVQEAPLPFYQRPAAAEGNHSLENQFRDNPDPAMFMNWDSLSYVAGMMLTPTAPNQQQFKSKSSGRKRLSDLSWDIAQSIQKQQQEQAMLQEQDEQAMLQQQHEQAMLHPDAREQTGACSEKGNDDTNVLIGPAIQREQCSEDSYLNKKDPNLKVRENLKFAGESGCRSPIVTDREETNYDPPEVTADAPRTFPKQDPSPPKFIQKDLININPEAFTQVKHLTVSVKEEPLDEETDCVLTTENTARPKDLYEDDTISHKEDFDYSTDEYEAEAYFQKLDDSSVEGKDEKDMDWTPESKSPKKTLKIKIKPPKPGSKRKGSKKTGEDEVPKKKRRKKKKKVVEEDDDDYDENEELPTTVCTDSNTLYVIPPEENGTPGSKKKRPGK